MLVHIYAYILFLIYVLPVVLIVLFSFTDAKTIATRKLSLSAFTLDNYKTILTEASAYRPFIVSVIYSLLSAVAVAILVLMACRIIQKNKNKASAALEYGLLIPWLASDNIDCDRIDHYI